MCNNTLGKFKLECKVKEGFFLAPKSYYIRTDKDEEKIAHKGPAKQHVTREWFYEQLLDEEMTKKVVVTTPFRVDKSKMVIREVTTEYTLAFPSSKKRERVYKKINDKLVWVDTKPVRKELKDLDEKTRLLIESLEPLKKDQ